LDAANGAHRDEAVICGTTSTKLEKQARGSQSYVNLELNLHSAEQKAAPNKIQVEVTRRAGEDYKEIR